MTLGETIVEARKARGMKQEALARAIGLTAPAVSGIENDTLKNGPAPQLIIRIADILGCDAILYKYIEDNPVYKAIIPKVFPDLNNIRTEPAVIFNKTAREMEEGREAALELAEIFTNVNPRRIQGFDERFKARFQQVVDVKRCVEILETQLIASHIISQSDLRQIYAEQQAKCEANGHHIPEQRTGTEG